VVRADHALVGRRRAGTTTGRTAVWPPGANWNWPPGASMRPSGGRPVGCVRRDDLHTAPRPSRTGARAPYKPCGRRRAGAQAGLIVALLALGIVLAQTQHSGIRGHRHRDGSIYSLAALGWC